jgi:DNA-binding ferritin-like protein
MATMGRASTAARGVARSMKESGDVARADETVEAITQQLQDLNAQLESEIAQQTSSSDPATEKLETVSIKPKKKDISVKLFGLVWAPYLQAAGKPPEAAW